MLDKEKLRQHLLKIFVDELDRQVESLRDAMTALREGNPAVRQEQIEIARRAAHSLKGAARSAGVPEIQKSALQVERAFAEVHDGRRSVDSLDFPLLYAAADAFAAAGQDLRAGRPVAGTRVEQVFPELEALAEGRVAAPRPTPDNSADAAGRHGAPRVLVVDDADTNRNFIKIVLEAQGYQVLDARDGEDAIGVLNANSVDVILADVNMPRMDGFQLTETVRHSAAWHDLPVILLTGLENPAERARGEQVGASAYLAKGSTDNRSLLATIESFLAA